jgi:hypothetical protein
VKFGPGVWAADIVKGANGKVKALMPLQSSMVQHDKPAIVSRPPGPEKIQVNVIDKDRTLFLGYGTGCRFFGPKVVRDDNVVGKTSGKSLDELQKPDIKAAFRLAELVGEEFR